MRKIVFLLLAALSFSVFAQKECAFELEEAQEMFDAGLIEIIPDKLADCLKRGFTSEEKLQAYKLIILSYLFDDDYLNADNMMLEFLRDFPAYEPVATDPMEFIAMMETYDTRPILQFGGRFGSSVSFPSVIENLGSNNNAVHIGRYTPGRAGFQGAAKVEKMIGYHLFVSAEVAFVNAPYEYYLEDKADDPEISAEITDFSIIRYSETQNSLHLPLCMSYTPGEKDFKPYVTVGISPGILLSAKAEGGRSYKNTGEINYNEITVADVGLMEIRKVFNMWLFASAGFKVDAGPGELFFDFRYSYNLFNQVPDDAPLYLDQLSPLLYVPDQIRLNSMTFSVGYLFPLYHPKKKAE